MNYRMRQRLHTTAIHYVQIEKFVMHLGAKCLHITDSEHTRNIHIERTNLKAWRAEPVSMECVNICIIFSATHTSLPSHWTPKLGVIDIILDCNKHHNKTQMAFSSSTVRSTTPHHHQLHHSHHLHHRHTAIGMCSDISDHGSLPYHGQMQLIWKPMGASISKVEAMIMISQFKFAHLLQPSLASDHGSLSYHAPIHRSNN